MVSAFAIALALALPPRPTTGAKPDTGPAPLVVVDPGHGGKDAGAMHGGVHEDEVNLAAARALAAALRADGYRVLMTREEGCSPALYSGSGRSRPQDMPTVTVLRPGGCRLNLRDRVLRGFASGESVFISVHCDHYADPRVHGPRTYYGPGSQAQKQLAQSIQHELNAFRTRPFTPVAADHFVLMVQPNVPAVTVEMGFLTNARERRLLKAPEYRKRLALAVTRGLDAYARRHPLLPPPAVDLATVDNRWRSLHPRRHS